MADGACDAPRTLADFDFDFQPNLDRKVVAELSTLRFVEDQRNVILLGSPGVGKTHLAIALGVAAMEADYRTYFTSASDLAQTLQAAHLEGLAQLKLRTYTRPSLLVTDKLGDLPLDQASGNWIFQVVSRRYDLGSVILYVPTAASQTGAGLRRPGGRRRHCRRSPARRHRAQYPRPQPPDARLPGTHHS